MPVDCVSLISEATGLSKRAAASVLREIREDATRQGILNDPEAVVKMAQELKAKKKADATQALRRAKITAVKLGDAVGGLSGYKSRKNAVYAFLTGSDEKVEGAKLSVESRQNAIVGEVQEGMFRDLNEGHDGIVKLMNRKEFGPKVAAEMWNETGASITGDADAFHAAQVFGKWKEIVRAWANKEGANIARIPSHVFAQVHDQHKIAKAGFEKWRDAILPRLDIQKTFGGQDPEPVLKSIYNKIEKDAYNVFTGNTAPSLAGKMSRERFLQFKNAEDWLSYDKEFGTGSGNIMEPMLGGIMRRAKEVGLMQKMGPNPDDFMTRFLKAAERTDPSSAKDKMTQSQAKFAKDIYDNLAGHDRIASNPRIAKFMQNTRSYLGFTNLGWAAINSFNDIGTAGIISSYNGKNIFSQYNDIFAPMHKDPQFARFAETFSDGFITSVAGRFSLEDGMIGKSSKWANAYFKMNMLTPWTDHFKEAEAWSLSRHIADQADTAYDGLSDGMKNTLKQYDIDANGWDSIRANKGDIDGKAFITPEMVGDEELSRKLRMFFMNEVETAIPTPGAYQRAFVLRGTKPGTLYGEVARSFGQFKMFTLTMTQKVLPRVHEMGIPGYIHLAATMAFFGYASMAAKNALSGQRPPDPLDPKTLPSALLKSGGMGILADMLLSDYGSYGRGFLEVMAGPTGGLLNDAGRLWSSAIRGDAKAGDAIKLAMRNVPMQNLFYSQMATNYLFTYQIQEMLDPGYLKRMERRATSDSNKSWLSPPDKSYWLKPSDVIQRGGGFR